jgi:hypothetical protein
VVVVEIGHAHSQTVDLQTVRTPMEFSRYSSYPLSKMHVYDLGSREESMRRAERTEQMTRAQKHFMGYGRCPVKERLASTTLPKFILRERGRGFGMTRWGTSNLIPGELVMFDGLHRPAPSCGTVLCIGGSAQFLLKLVGRADNVARALGLDWEEAEAVFFRWMPNYEGVTHWPDSFAEAYAAADTPYKKAKVAAALLKLVAKTEGRCLYDGWKPKGRSK